MAWGRWGSLGRVGVPKGVDWLVMMGWPGRMGWRERISLGKVWRLGIWVRLG